MKFKGVIFDFNGTLFYDTPKHIEAWREYSARLRGTPFSDDEMEKHMLGHTNEDIIAYAIGEKPDKKMVQRLAAEKEAVYREMCLNDMKNTKLAKGAVEFLEYLEQNSIPHTIATASDKTNVDFFIEIFHLKNWFDVSKIVYDDGKIPNKPEPDIYLKAASNLSLKPCECLVFEDAMAGIESAKRAGIGGIVAVVPDDKKQLFQKISCVSSVISDFTQFEFNCFSI